MGLREAKKERLRSSVIENAVALFREHGFESTTVRQICASCEISEATFFNYFPTKGSVLGAWAHGVVDERLAGVDASPERGLRPSVRSLCADLGQAIEEDAVFAARAWSRAVIPAQPPEAAERLIRMGQQADQLRRDLSARQMGGILYVSLFGTIADWLVREPPRGPLASELRRAADLVLDGSRRRNERVRPTAGPAVALPPGPGSSPR